MTEQELKSLNIENENGIFEPSYEYKSYDFETKTYTGLEIIKTAEQVYREWLDNKDKPVSQTPTLEDRMDLLEQLAMELILL